jgi:hypothetical protein
MSKTRRELSEMFGMLLTKPDAAACRSLFKERKMSASEFLRECAIRPLIQVQASAAVVPGGVQDDPDAA